MIEITARYLEHSGGTKFYETVTIADNDSGRYVLVKRWGAIGTFKGGGQVKIEVCGHPADLRREKSFIEKQKMSKGYKPMNVAYGLHATSGNEDAGETSFAVNTENAAVAAIQAHYAKEAAHRIVSDLDVDVDIDIDDEVVVEELTPRNSKLATSIDRGDSWGSW